MPEYLDPFYGGGYYHVFNRTVGSEKLFRETDNYHYFLKKWNTYLNPVADTFCYALLPTHFHFFLRLKDLPTLAAHFDLPPDTIRTADTIDSKITKLLGNLFNSYSKAFNKRFERHGRLFSEPFQRRQVTDPNYYTRLVYYIHSNAAQHGYCTTVPDWPHSSYALLLREGTGNLCSSEMLEWFGGREEFERFHAQPIIKK